jgi:hypothetical protein
MNGGAAAAGFIYLAIFLGGVVLGVIAMVAVSVRREDRLFSLSGAAPGAAARGTRWLVRFGGSGEHHRPRDWAQR